MLNNTSIERKTSFVDQIDDLKGDEIIEAHFEKTIASKNVVTDINVVDMLFRLMEYLSGKDDCLLLENDDKT